jgi:periplasmic divalent cation tolerance protein
LSDYIQIVTTTAGREEAQTIARALVEERLAGCVQVLGPITSTYRWKGAIETSEEWQLWIKSRSELFTQIEQTIRRLHSYEVPEIIAVPILAGSESYLAWLGSELNMS